MNDSSLLCRVSKLELQLELLSPRGSMSVYTKQIARLEISSNSVFRICVS